ncbi:hypothetical protein PHYPSEUDO_001557 [Phytophthora pseudosyringae]|uniref:M96 mating-specific protein n=1 Tax=Phytophthora pseudosyringae TaxID=221518 RepID=A0A8T1V3A7_9STRA|nr:hypothetical protein PHYPSEUDO_001557 [Phytophthora pseudosyringae]
MTGDCDDHIVNPDAPLHTNRTLPPHSSLSHFSSRLIPGTQQPTDQLFSREPSNSPSKMHSKILLALALCVAASMLQATDARGAPARMSPRRQLGSYKDYGHHSRKHDHDHDHKRKHDRHDKDHYRRRLEDKGAKSKATESSDYSYGKDDYGHDDYGHDDYGYKHDDYGHDDYEHKGYGYKNDDYDYKGYGGSYSYGGKSYGE